ncbi:hypothetical protein [Roseovarius salinarum]|uniref:hypothetical protein n=1 Tax=Roseovarius salinarum TaxID=1981892 RepID=UPI000C32825D|nr:hypothetical protein [Roseovarius salinarum]
MRRNGWHILRDDAGLTMARQLPVRFDLAVHTRFPACDRLRLARQVRQDVWRALRGLRGFAPAVRVVATGHGFEVTAGGRLDGAGPRDAAQARIAAVLEDPGRRARWLRWATE